MKDESAEPDASTDERGQRQKIIEKGVTRRHTFFCVERKRHTEKKTVIEAVPKTITVCGRRVEGWIITTEEQVIDKTITLAESMEGLGLHHDTE
jgi:hypothetical protein